MKIVFLFFSLVNLISSASLEFFKISFPPESGKATIDFKDNTWIQLNAGPNWSLWRFDLNYFINSQEVYKRIQNEMPFLTQYLNCNIVGSVQLRCIFWGNQIVKQIDRIEKDNYICYSFEIKNPDSTQKNSVIEFKITENVIRERDMIDSIVSHQDPELLSTKFLE